MSLLAGMGARVAASGESLRAVVVVVVVGRGVGVEGCVCVWGGH
jgi:hypothetical protein